MGEGYGPPLSWGRENSLRGWRRRQLGRWLSHPEQTEEKAAARLHGSTEESQGSASGGGVAATDRVGSIRAVDLGPGVKGKGAGGHRRQTGAAEAAAKSCVSGSKGRVISTVRQDGGLWAGRAGRPGNKRPWMER